ncbi:MAG: AAA family ATPase [Chloroflexi bacterium]|nr:AAA family ATPase [Chloroflexota bacterium]
METYATFLPIDRRLALAAGSDLPDRTNGAALFADISGFTPLTAVLAQELGPHRGAEELTRHLNHVFSSLIAQVHLYMGNVIGFSGDAITCWFDENDSPELDPATLALACALQLQRVMAQLEAMRTPQGHVISLALKVALAAGPVRRFLVGDPEKYVMETMAGSTLDQMAAAEKQAIQGEVVVTADFLERLPVRPVVSTWRRDDYGQRFAVISSMTFGVSPTQRPPIPPIPAAIARQWLLPPVFARLRQGADDFLADLRPATVLFLRFSGIDYDGDDCAGEKLDAFVRRTQAILDDYEGFLIQLTVGDKGSYFYITFGAPIAHENDPVRAAAAALALRDLPAEFPFLQPLHMGISQGLAHSSAYGSPERRCYGVMGNEVNISARLMTTAQPGQILLAPTVAEMLRSTFSLAALPPVRLKGIREPLPVWELGERLVIGRTVVWRSAMPMVGRATERQQLAEALDRLANGRSNTVIVEGQAGIGKSRLAQELLDLIEPEITPVVVGSGDAVQQSAPYHAWRPIFEQLFVQHSDSPAPNQETPMLERIREGLDPALHDLLPLLKVVLRLELPETTLTAQLTGEARQDNTHRLLVGLLKSVVRQPDTAVTRPLVLIIEDAHWLDSASWLLLRRVHQQIDPLLLVLVARPFSETDMTPTLYADLAALSTTKRLVLDLLPVPAVEELICQRLGVRSLPTAVTHLIHAKAEGHPFFSEEMAYALRDAGLVQIKDGECHLAANIDAFNALDFPNTIQGVITSRIDKLLPAHQLTVKVASVIGRIFAFKLLTGIYPVDTDADHLREHLDHLEQLGITPLETPAPNLAYIFKHLVTQEVVYNLMTFAQRQQLHRRTAVWYENNQSGDLSLIFPLLAYHWQQAGDVEKAVTYYEKAGENAFRDYANQEAIRFFTKAVELGGETSAPTRRARWQRHLGEAAYRLTLVEKSEAHYLAALELLERPLPSALLTRALGLGQQLIRQANHYRRSGRSQIPAASETYRQSLLEAARAYEGISEIYYNTGDFLTTFYCVMAALNHSEKAGVSPESVRGCANMCPTLGTVGLHKLAASYRQRALAMAADLDDLTTTAYIQVPFSSYSLWVGDWERAEHEIDQALAIYSRLGDWRHWCVVAWVWPQIAQYRSGLHRAQELWAELYEIARSSQDTRHQVRSRGGQVFNLLALGKPDEAFACADSVGVLIEENPEMFEVEERLWYAILAVRTLHEERWVEARALAHEQIAAIGRAQFKFDLLDVFAASAEVFLTLWEMGLADKKEARKGCQVLSRYARTYPFARPRALCCQAKFAWLDGNRGKAQMLWGKGDAQAAALAMPYEQTHIREVMEKYTTSG